MSQTRVAIAFCESEYPEAYPELFGTACTKRVVAREPAAVEIVTGGR